MSNAHCVQFVSHDGVPCVCVYIENSGERQGQRWESTQTEGGSPDATDSPHTSVSGSDSGAHSAPGPLRARQGTVRFTGSVLNCLFFFPFKSLDDILDYFARSLKLPEEAYRIGQALPRGFRDSSADFVSSGRRGLFGESS